MITERRIALLLFVTLALSSDLLALEIVREGFIQIAAPDGGQQEWVVLQKDDENFSVRTNLQGYQSWTYSGLSDGHYRVAAEVNGEQQLITEFEVRHRPLPVAFALFAAGGLMFVLLVRQLFVFSRQHSHQKPKQDQ